jgi:hypothetical protein
MSKTKSPTVKRGITIERGIEYVKPVNKSYVRDALLAMKPGDTAGLTPGQRQSFQKHAKALKLDFNIAKDPTDKFPFRIWIN